MSKDWRINNNNSIKEWREQGVASKDWRHGWIKEFERSRSRYSFQHGAGARSVGARSLFASRSVKFQNVGDGSKDWHIGHVFRIKEYCACTVAVNASSKHFSAKLLIVIAHEA
jgi:hypothetical protein